MRRSDARAQALSVLYEADTRREAPADAIERREEGPLDEYALELVGGVTAHAEEIDGLITEHAHRWAITHMPVVDRNALRLGLYEVLWGDVPPAVAMDEAVELCKRFSTDEAARFVNGILAAVAAERL